jgi:formylglycine-generating enzyme required for sulfatase activity
VDRVGEQDRVLIFFSGHGETKSPRAGGGKEMGFLLPVGAEADKLAETAIPMSMIRDLADALPSKHVLFLVDVCYGGIAGTQFKGVLTYDEAYLREITRERGRQLITAGGPKQEALEGPEWGHSVFTYYLLQGIEQGLADLDGDGIIPASELHKYLDRRVFDAAQSKGHKQRPELWKLASEPGEFVFFASARPGSAAGGGAPARPSAPSLSAPPGTGVDLGAYEQYEALARLAEQREQAWAKVKAFAGKTGVAKEKRLAALDKFLADFADDNPHLGEVEALKQQIQAEMQVAKAPTYEAPRQMGRERRGQDGAPMVLIPAGEFLMGSTEGGPDEKPVHRVSLDAFYLDQYEVTNKRFQQFVQETGYKTTAEKAGTASAGVLEKGFFWDSWKRKEIRGANWRKPEGGETVFVTNREEHPVVAVSWDDAEAYCRWAGKRLPTEAEFEYADRGGTRTTSWWGDGPPGSRRVANLADETAKRQFGWAWAWSGYEDGYARTAPVGSFEPNPFGLYDTTGNVWEWTADWYGEDYYGQSPRHNPTGPSSGTARVLRGGSGAATPGSCDRRTGATATR